MVSVRPGPGTASRASSNRTSHFSARTLTVPQPGPPYPQGMLGGVGGTPVAVTNGDVWRWGVSAHCPAGHRMTSTAEDHRPRSLMCKGTVPRRTACASLPESSLVQAFSTWILQLKADLRRKSAFLRASVRELPQCLSTPRGRGSRVSYRQGTPLLPALEEKWPQETRGLGKSGEDQGRPTMRVHAAQKHALSRPPSARMWFTPARAWPTRVCGFSVDLLDPRSHRGELCGAAWPPPVPGSP